MSFLWMVHRFASSRSNTLQLPAEPWLYATGSADHIIHNPGQSHALVSWRDTCTWGDWYSSGIDGSSGESPSPASTSRASSHDPSLKTPCGDLSSHYGPDLAGWLCPCCSWRSCPCHHLDQLLGQWWSGWPPCLLMSCHFLSPPFQFLLWRGHPHLEPLFPPHPWSHFSSHHAGKQKEPIRGCGGLYCRCV